MLMRPVTPSSNTATGRMIGAARRAALSPRLPRRTRPGRKTSSGPLPGCMHELLDWLAGQRLSSDFGKRARMDPARRRPGRCPP